MYYIGPLLFWACAEMTCGFFILCVPCLPKLISESGCSRRVKKALGISTGSKPNASGQGSSNLNSKFGGSYASRKKTLSTDILNTTVDASAYYEIDEEVMGMDNLKASDSTEQLRNNHHGAGGVHVTKTVVVTKSHSLSGTDDEYNLSKTPWARSAK